MADRRLGRSPVCVGAVRGGPVGREQRPDQVDRRCGGVRVDERRGRGRLAHGTVAGRAPEPAARGAAAARVRRETVQRVPVHDAARVPGGRAPRVRPDRPPGRDQRDRRFVAARGPLRRGAAGGRSRRVPGTGGPAAVGQLYARVGAARAVSVHTGRGRIRLVPVPRRLRRPERRAHCDRRVCRSPRPVERIRRVRPPGAGRVSGVRGRRGRVPVAAHDGADGRHAARHVVRHGRGDGAADGPRG